MLVVLIALVVAAYWLFDGQRFVSVDFFLSVGEHYPRGAAAVYFAIYVLVAAFSLPAAALLTVIGGMIFGLATGTVLVSFASSIGATLACAFARFILRDGVQQRLGSYLENMNEGLERDGARYLLSLRLIPLFPFWAINLAFGLTRIPLGKFYIISQLGMLPATLVYVNAGAQLGAVGTFSLQGILTPTVIGSFTLLGLFPFFVKGVVAWLHRRKLYRRYPKPRVFDANLIVIGAGSAGLVAAYIAATVKAKAVLIEKHLMGGDCLNTGCVPSKALIRVAKAAHELSTAADFGIEVGHFRVDFPQVMAHVHSAVAKVAPHDSVARYTELGVHCVRGAATLTSPWSVEVNGETIRAPKIIIATGARPRVPSIPGLAQIDYLTSDNLWDLRVLPKRLLIMGGGPIGCEMAQAFQRLGSQVTLVQRPEYLLPKEDVEASRLVAAILQGEGVEVLLQHQVVGFEKRGEDIVVTVLNELKKQQLSCDRVLVAVGRQANTQGLGLDERGILRKADGTLEVDAFLRTTVPNIYACGDVCGPYQYTHASSHQAWYAAVNALFGGIKKFKVDHRLMPSVTYTDPEVASVGLNEKSAAEKDVAIEVTSYPLDDLDRAIADRATQGFVKIFTAPGKDKILGVTIVGARGADMLMEFIIAMKHGKSLNSVLSTIHPYPTHGEANKMAAGLWKKNHAPKNLLRWVERYHRWQRKA